MLATVAYSRIAAAASGLSNFANVFTYSSVFLYTLSQSYDTCQI